MTTHRKHTLRLSLCTLLAIVGLSISMLSYAATGDVLPMGTATIKIEQKSNDDIIGTWTLLKPGNEHQEGSGEAFSLTNAPAGTYTIIAKQPDGMSATMRSYRDEVPLDTVERPQITFAIADGETVRVAIHYSLTRVGIIAVNSDPAGLDFELKGPNNSVIHGTTPASYDNAAEGQYRLQFDTVPGCIVPAPKGAQLQNKGRINFQVKIVCDAATKIRDRQEKKGEDFVMVKSDGQEVTFRDVPRTAWFASFVFDVARRNVLTGYRSADGRPSGDFGPGNNVTVGELAKIAHKLGSVSEETFANVTPDNPLAANQWFSPFIASAEHRGWVIFQSTIDPARPATRGEVVVTFLQVLNVPVQWQKGTVFTDVSARTTYAAAIETAAAAGLIDGRSDPSNEAQRIFAPNDSINRAEISKIIGKAFELYKK